MYDYSMYVYCMCTLRVPGMMPPRVYMRRGGSRFDSPKNPIMGAAASLTQCELEGELARPVDATDVATPRGDSAKQEVARLRALLRTQADADARAARGATKMQSAARARAARQRVETIQQGNAAVKVQSAVRSKAARQRVDAIRQGAAEEEAGVGTDSMPPRRRRSSRSDPWRQLFGRYKTLRCADQVAAAAARDPLVLAAFDRLKTKNESRQQNAEGAGGGENDASDTPSASRITVLGTNTPTSPGYPPQEVDPCALRVLEQFDSAAGLDAPAWHDEGTATAEVIVQGPMLHLQKPGAGSGPCYVIVGTQSVKSRDDVPALVECHKAVGIEQLGFEEGALAYSIVLNPDAESRVLWNVAWFASREAHEAHKSRRDPARMAFLEKFMGLVDMNATDVNEAGMREFAGAAHLERAGLKKGKGLGVQAIRGFGEEE